MDVTVWSDVICPWAYLGRDRSAIMADELGCTVQRRCYELHPELSPEPRTIRPEGRYGAVLSHVAELCAADGIPFSPPTRTSNSREALLAIEIVRLLASDALERFEGVLFEAHFVHDELPGSPDVLRDAFSTVGISPEDATTERRQAAMAALVAEREHARSVGVSATPSWLFPTGFVLPGAQSRSQTRRWVGRIVAKSERPGGTPADR